MSLQAELARTVKCSSADVGLGGASILHKAYQKANDCFRRFVAAMEESKRREGTRLIRRYSHLIDSDDRKE
jgi:hypothetical protein